MNTMNIYDIANGLMKPKAKKKRYRFNHDTQQWDEVKPPQPKLPDGHRGMAPPPKVGEPCRKCHGSGRHRTIHGDAGPCYWYTNNGITHAVYTEKDVALYKHRLAHGLPLDHQVSA